MVAHRARLCVIHPEFRQDLRYWIQTDRKTALRAMDLVDAVMRDPFQGIGKPEPLKYLAPGTWSRRLTQAHRIVSSAKTASIFYRRDITINMACSERQEQRETNMAKSFDDLVARTTIPQVRARAKELTRKYLAQMLLSEIRKLAGKSQSDLARILGVKQPGVSKLEQQDDMQISRSWEAGHPTF